MNSTRNIRLRASISVAAVLCTCGLALAQQNAAGGGLVVPADVLARRQAGPAGWRGNQTAPKAFGQIDEFTYQRTKEELVRMETANWDGKFDMDLVLDYPAPIDKRDFRKPRLDVPHEPDTIAVAFKPYVTRQEIDKAIAWAGAAVVWESRLVRNLFHVRVAGQIGASVDAFLDLPVVLYAAPIYQKRALTVPNDPEWSNGQGPFSPDAMWGMMRRHPWQGGQSWLGGSQAELAWDEWTGDPNFKVAVIDSGADLAHADLNANVWFNGADGGHDGDGNGYNNDHYGWNTTTQSGWFNEVNYCGNVHGTHCAGTVGAAGNNGTGVVGVNWACKLVIIRCSNGAQCCDGTPPCGGMSNTHLGIEYAAMTGVRVSNNSYGGPTWQQPEYDKINAAQGRNHIVVAAAGNDGADTDVTGHYPSGYPLSNIISVANIMYDGERSSSSNYGWNTVDIAAPGREIYSTMQDSSYGALSGTSMAAPHVAGAIALVWSRYPSLPWWKIKQRILEGFPNGNVACSSGCQLDVLRALGLWVSADGSSVAFGNQGSPLPPALFDQPCEAFDSVPSYGTINFMPGTGTVKAPRNITKPMTLQLPLGGAPAILVPAP